MTRVRDVIDSWPFTPTAIDLYVHAMAWKGASIVGFKGDENRSSEGLALSQEALLELLPDYLVDGRVRARVVSDGEVVSLARGGADESNFEIVALKDFARGEFGRSPFETATANHEATIEMKKLLRLGPNPAAEMMLQTIRNDVMRTFSIPEWMYKKEQAGQADMWAVLHGVDMFRIMASSYRDEFGRAIVYALKDWFASQDPPLRHPTPVWFADLSGTTGVAGLDGIYWAFRESGVPLTRFGAEFVDWLRKSVNTIPITEHRDALASWEAMGL